jgi:SAM-dependent methyltransferase
MAELKTIENEDVAGCCSATAQATCCEPETKGECCGADHAAGTCGCSAGGAGDQHAGAGPDAGAQHPEDVREAVRERYAAAAVAAGAGAGCCGEAAAITDEQREAFGARLYGDSERDELPATAKLASLGCGNPTAVASLAEGETVLDLGSGGGIDVLLSARRVGPTGKAYGLDMTEEMLDLARRNQREAGIANAEFLKGTIEEVPLPDGSVDAVISNCVINLSADKPAVFREAARVLRAGGRLALTDVIADPGMDDATRSDLAQWTGCIAGALTEHEFRAGLEAAGFEGVEIVETHRVHEHAGSAIVRATRSP